METNEAETLNFTSGDNARCTLIDNGDVILRKYNKDASEYVCSIFDEYIKYGLKDYGIVSTTHNAATYTLFHKKHIISYANEWSPSMFKDAVLYHLDLLLNLERFGLTLKDALPENILFNGVQPVFVDFFSLIYNNELKNETWLMDGVSSDLYPNFRVLELMFVPYLLIPLLCYLYKDFSMGQKLLDEYFCNNITKKTGSWKTIQKVFLQGYLRSKIYGFMKSSFSVIKRQRRELYHLCRKKSIPWTERIMRVRSVIKTCNVIPDTSGYLSYYAEKKEDFGLTDKDHWKEKQKSVCMVFNRITPTKVLDIGANTGWYSRLACKNGAKVIATDMDVASIDALYREARMCSLPITSLWMSFDDFTKERYSLDENGNVNKHPLHMAGTKRLSCDLVLCLGFLHHLTLGMGKSFREVFEVLAKLTKKTLLIEFVNLDDSLIKEEPEFFQHMSSWNASNYNKDAVIDAGLSYFSSYEILPSNPETRVLIIFEKEIFYGK